jgi:Tfp pilus assembly ATPase PilU
MQTFSQSLIELVLKGEVEREVAANAATNRHDFLVDLERAEKEARAVAREEAEAASSAAGDGGLEVVEPLGASLR